MEALDINGVKVLFPYKPYDIQLDYMKSVIQCLQQKSNGLLESPTGTGKTLCILCATLGWVDSQKLSALKQMVEKSGLNGNELNASTSVSVPKSLNGWQLSDNSPQILYSSRTHQQLSQACSELKRTAYNSYKAVVIGSRDQLCLNSDVSKLESISAKNQSCRHKIQNNLCAYYRNYEQKVDRNVDYNSHQVFDIEDLVKLGKKNTCCPYYASRHIRTKASLVFTPYNYILDPQIRLSNALEVKNSVVIFDEGHNIEKVCEESVSSELRSDSFAVCIKHINAILEKLRDINDGSYDGSDAKELSELSVESVAKLKLTVCDLESAFDSLIKDKPSTKTLHETAVIFKIMERVGLDVNTCMQTLDIMDKISMTLTNSNTMAATQALVLSASFTSLAQFLERLIPIKLSTFDEYESHKLEFIKKFKIFSERGTESDDQKTNFWNKKSSPDAWVLHIWCLSPSVGAKSLLDMGIHSLIITSGTLAPMNSFEAEMDIKFAIKLQNSHIIGANQLSILNISNSRDNTVLTSKYDNRDNIQYYRALGQTLLDILTVVPKGVLIFFSSYTALNKCIAIWKQNDNFWVRLNCVKQIFLEPRNKRTFNDCITQYKHKIDEPNSSGAVFFGVFRGKLSEGMDLPDDYCRCVIMTGLPFPAVADPRVILKKQYLNEAKIELTANGWYALQMKRALNQAIGRVVRHKDDFGVIILLDSRFATLNDGLSKWVEKYIIRNRFKNLDESLAKLNSFFSNRTSTSNSENISSVKTSINSQVMPKTVFKNTEFKSFSNISQKSATNGLKDGTIILNEFKTNDKFNQKPIPESNSIFDSISSGMSSTCVESKPNNFSNLIANNSVTNEIDLDPSPQKRIRLNVPLKSISLATPTQPEPEPKASTPDTKLHGIIKSKASVETNSSKKVRWNEERNTVHELKPIAIDFTEDVVNESKNKTVVPFEVKCSNSEEKPVVKVVDEATERMLVFWRKNGAQLKQLFKGTNSFGKICEGIREFKKFKNILTLSAYFNMAFKRIDKQMRDKWIKELSIIVPKSERYIFLKKCYVEVSANEFGPNTEFKIIERKDNLIPKTHFCMICESKSAVSPHRTLCCGYIACLKCFKRSKHLNRSNNCVNCNKPLKMSDLRHLRFSSAFL